MQPNAPGQYTQQPLGPNPYVQQMPSVPVVPPSSGRGVSIGVIVSFILTIILLLGAIGFGAWAYMGRQDYKNNVDQKVSAAVETAVKDEDAKKDAEFVEKEKEPYRLYTSPATYGAIGITYSKTWSAYVVEANSTQSGSTPIDAYFHPGFVPGVQSGTEFALHLRVVSQAYSTIMNQYSASVKAGKVTVSPYTAPNVPGVMGSRVDGVFEQDKSGSMVLIPLRDKTIEISTQSQTYMSDFENTVLANLTFQP